MTPIREADDRSAPFVFLYIFAVVAGIAACSRGSTGSAVMRENI